MPLKISLLLFIALFFLTCKQQVPKNPIPAPVEIVELDREMAQKLSRLAFKCIDTEYPNKLGQVLGSQEDLLTPKRLHPAFYGCFDWHSAVHGHWTLIKLLKLFPDLDNRDSIILKINQNLTEANIAQEIDFWKGPHNSSFERTYGWAWLLKLQQELSTWDTSEGQKWAKVLQPMSDYLTQKYLDYLPKLNYPIRVGEHTNTAFGLAFALDYAHTMQRDTFFDFLQTSGYEYYLQDNHCPVSWEPSGYDFLSPCLEEAQVMSKILSAEEFRTWWTEFLPDNSWGRLSPATSKDLTDGKLVHLVGLNFSRAWCLFDIAKVLQNDDLKNLAELHISHSIGQVINGDYAGEHWLASFAVMALTNRY